MVSLGVAQCIDRRISGKGTERIGVAEAATGSWERRDACATADATGIGLARRRRISNAGWQAVDELWLNFNPERIGEIRMHRDLSHAVEQVDQLVVVVLRRQLSPCGITDDRIHMELIYSAQQGSFERLPACGVGTKSYALYLHRGESCATRCRRSLGPHVVRPSEPCRAQPEKLPLAGRQG